MITHLSDPREALYEAIPGDAGESRPGESAKLASKSCSVAQKFVRERVVASAAPNGMATKKTIITVNIVLIRIRQYPRKRETVYQTEATKGVAQTKPETVM